MEVVGVGGRDVTLMMSPFAIANFEGRPVPGRAARSGGCR